MELWKDSPIYPEQYEVSNVGRVKNKITGHIIKAKKDRLGYLYYNLYFAKRPRTVKAHRLVAIAFLNNPENKPTVDHINGIKDDNRVENLRWATSKEQMQNPNTMKKLYRGGSGSHFPFWKFSVKRRAKKVAITYKDGDYREYESLSELCENENMRINRVSEILHGKRKQPTGKTITFVPKA